MSSPSTETATLARAIESAVVDVDELRRLYGPLLNLVRVLIGVVPNCDRYLEIWPIGFRTYNVMVPNLLNLPAVFWGRGAPKQTLGLAMYAASRAAGCAYCSAHTCAFALRRGASPPKIASATAPQSMPGGLYSPAELAAIEFADAVARVPATLTGPQRELTARHFSPAQFEWLTLSVAMMGFLNKFMDAVGVDLEQPTVTEVGPVIRPSGWAPGKHRVGPAVLTPTGGAPLRVDSVATILRMLPHLPGAISRDRRWTSEVPATGPAAGTYLRERTGYDFPLLSSLRHRRPVRAIATMIRDNFGGQEGHLDLRTKHLAGLVYAEIVADRELGHAARAMAQRAAPGDSTAALAAVTHFAAAPIGLDVSVDDAAAQLRAVAGLDDTGVAALVLARAASPSPSKITPQVIEHVVSVLSPPAIVELLVSLSVHQLLHRLTVVYPMS